MSKKSSQLKRPLNWHMANIWLFCIQTHPFFFFQVFNQSFPAKLLNREKKKRISISLCSFVIPLPFLASKFQSQQECHYIKWSAPLLQVLEAFFFMAVYINNNMTAMDFTFINSLHKIKEKSFKNIFQKMLSTVDFHQYEILFLFHKVSARRKNCHHQ